MFHHMLTPIVPQDQHRKKYVLQLHEQDSINKFLAGQIDTHCDFKLLLNKY